MGDREICFCKTRELFLSKQERVRGFVIRAQSGFFTIETETGLVTCRLRGRLKRGPRLGDILAVGDWVKISQQPDGSGMIEEIEERERMFSRMAPTPRGEYQQIIIANPDQVVLVFACAEPEPRLRMLDRFLIVAEKAETPTIIVFNKVDLVGIDQAQERFGHYAELGYPVIFTSVESGLGVDELAEWLARQTSVLAGPSGVGKSSLLNKIQPGLGLSVRDISHSNRKGRHTTVVRELFALDGGGYVADTPGLKALALWDIEPEEVDAYFPELRDLVADCQFSNCMHIHEPGCEVMAAVEDGRVRTDRYDSYVRLRQGEEDEL